MLVPLLILAFVVVFLGARLGGSALAASLPLSPGIIALLVLGTVYAVVSLAVRILQKRANREPSPETRRAIRLGVLWVNGPILPLLLGPFAIQRLLAGSQNAWLSGALLLLGVLLAWAWWSVNVSLWRRWAARSGVDADELQFEGEGSSLLWPQKHLLERTEYDNIRRWLERGDV